MEGELLARGSHTKYISFAYKDSKNKVDDMRKLAVELKEEGVPVEVVL